MCHNYTLVLRYKHTSDSGPVELGRNDLEGQGYSGLLEGMYGGEQVE